MFWIKILRILILQFNHVFFSFQPGCSVQPVLIRRPSSGLDTLTWTWHQSYGAMGCLWLTLCQWSSVFEVWYFSRTQNCHKIQTPEKWMKSTTCKHLALTSSLFTIITFCDCVSPLKKIYILLPLKKKNFGIYLSTSQVNHFVRKAYRRGIHEEFQSHRVFLVRNLHKTWRILVFNRFCNPYFCLFCLQ